MKNKKIRKFIEWLKKNGYAICFCAEVSNGFEKWLEMDSTPLENLLCKYNQETAND